MHAARRVDRKFCSAPVRILADLTSDKLAGPEHDRTRARAIDGGGLLTSGLGQA
jgi:hypothetical protein